MFARSAPKRDLLLDELLVSHSQTLSSSAGPGSPRNYMKANYRSEGKAKPGVQGLGLCAQRVINGEFTGLVLQVSQVGLSSSVSRPLLPSYETEFTVLAQESRLENASWTCVVVPWVTPLLVMLASHRGAPLQVPAAPFLIRLPADTPGKAVESGPRT